MDYYCYISRNKIDNLHSSISGTIELNKKEIREKNTSFTGGLKLNIISLFNGDATYGRTGRMQIERDVKKGYINKLGEVLDNIEYFYSVEQLKNVTNGYIYYTGLFKVENRAENIIAISSEVDEYKLVLDCSIINFSEYNEQLGTYPKHSGNFRFLSGEIDILFDTVFVFLAKKDNVIYGSPLYLKLVNKDSTIL